jgi:hypothetical protein
MGLCEGSTRWEEAAVRSSMPLVSDLILLKKDYIPAFCDPENKKNKNDHEFFDIFKPLLFYH